MKNKKQVLKLGRAVLLTMGKPGDWHEGQRGRDPIRQRNRKVELS